MKCSACGHDFAGGICPWCGTPAGRQSIPGVTRERLTTIRIYGPAEELVVTENVHDQSTILIGREAEGPIGNALERPDQRFSDVGRKHVSVTVDGPHIIVRDHKSTFGTWIDGERLEDREYRYLLPIEMRLATSARVTIEREW